MFDDSDILAILDQLEPRETAQLAGILAPTQEDAVAWFKRIYGVAAEFWGTHRGVELPLRSEHADAIFVKVNETTGGLTRHQLWAIFTDVGAYGENSVTSHLNNAHTIDNIARYTLNDIGTRLVPELLAHLKQICRPRGTFNGP